MPHKFRRFLLVAAFAAPLAFAESEPAAEAEDNEPFPILSATCEDIYDCFLYRCLAPGQLPREQHR